MGRREGYNAPLIRKSNSALVREERRLTSAGGTLSGPAARPHSAGHGCAVHGAAAIAVVNKAQERYSVACGGSTLMPQE